MPARSALSYKADQRRPWSQPRIDTNRSSQMILQSCSDTRPRTCTIAAIVIGMLHYYRASEAGEDASLQRSRMFSTKQREGGRGGAGRGRLDPRQTPTSLLATAIGITPASVLASYSGGLGMFVLKPYVVCGCLVMRPCVSLQCVCSTHSPLLPAFATGINEGVSLAHIVLCIGYTAFSSCRRPSGVVAERGTESMYVK